jgi:hypothetical protein
MNKHHIRFMIYFAFTFLAFFFIELYIHALNKNIFQACVAMLGILIEMNLIMEMTRAELLLKQQEVTVASVDDVIKKVNGDVDQSLTKKYKTK